MPRLSSITNSLLAGRTGLNVSVFQRPASITLENPNAYGTEVNDRFGFAMASSGNYVVVSAPVEDTATVPRSGKVYVFNKLTSELLYTLTSPTPSGHPNTDIANFGCALSISGTNLVVGARYDQSFEGRVYVYNLTTGSLLRTIQSSLTTGYSVRDFGFSLDTWNDYVIVGAPYSNYSATQEVGFAELFSISTGASIRVFLNPASSGGYAYDNFGEAVSIHNSRVLIGAAFDDISAVNSGRAYLFDRDAGTLLNTFIDPSPIVNQDWFSYGGVELNDSFIMIRKNSTNEIYVYDATTYSQLYVITNPNIDPTSTSDGFPSGNFRFYGNRFVVGAPTEMSTNTGVAYVFDLSSTPPTTYITVIQNPLAVPYVQFGAGIVDSDSVIIGAQNASSTGGASWSGKAFIFKNRALDLADLGSYGPSNGVRIPISNYVGTTNSEPDQTIDRNFVIRGKNAAGITIATYTPAGTMTLFFVNPTTYSGDGYGSYAFFSASAFGNIPTGYNNGAPIRDLINTSGVVTVEISWAGMAAPFIINLTS